MSSQNLASTNVVLTIVISYDKPATKLMGGNMTSNSRIFMDHRQPAPELEDYPVPATGLLDKIEVLIPRLRSLAEAGELDGDYWFDIATCNELMAGVVEAFGEPGELPEDGEPDTYEPDQDVS